MTVLAVEPAMPPHSNCLKASLRFLLLAFGGIVFSGEEGGGTDDDSEEESLLLFVLLLIL